MLKLPALQSTQSGDARRTTTHVPTGGHLMQPHRPPLRERAGTEQGFTLVELLVVVIIIGVLAAIAIPVFLNQREKAHTASVKSDLRNMVSAQFVYHGETGSFSSTVGGLRDEGFRESDADATVHGVCALSSGGDEAFIVAARHDAAGEVWVLHSAEMVLVESAHTEVATAMQDVDAGCTPDLS